MFNRSLIVCFILLSLSACSCNGAWTRSDTARELVYTGLVAIDWGQTLYAVDRPDQFHEHNKLLGEHPSRGAINLYAPSMMLFHAAVSCALPAKYRAYWQYGSAIGEGVVVINNHRIGTRPTY